MSDYSSDLDIHLRRIARNPSPWIRGIRLHPDDIEALPKAEPKPLWMGGLSPLMGTPIFTDETVARGGYEVATDEWIAAAARAREEGLSPGILAPEPTGNDLPPGVRSRSTEY